MKPANVLMLVVGVWMGWGGVSQLGLGASSWLAVATAEAASSDVEGRKHARKANHLADINKCKQAIPEFTKALRLLKDPTLLFNRAECYRRTGDATKAVADYRKFLAELPGAPNRTQVEGQIAALDRSATPAGRPPGTSARPTPTGSMPAQQSTARSVPLATPSASAPAAAPVAPSPPPPATPPPPPVVGEPVREAPEVAEHEAPDLDEPRSLRRARPPVERAQTPALIDSATQHEATEPEASSSHWWAWVLGAVVIGGGATATYFALKQGKTEIPSSTLGNFRF